MNFIPVHAGQFKIVDGLYSPLLGLGVRRSRDVLPDNFFRAQNYKQVIGDVTLNVVGPNTYLYALG